MSIYALFPKPKSFPYFLSYVSHNLFFSCKNMMIKYTNTHLISISISISKKYPVTNCQTVVLIPPPIPFHIPIQILQNLSINTPSSPRKLQQSFKAMANPSLILLSSFLFCLLLSSASAQLRQDFYKDTCPNVESLVRSAVQKKFQQTFVTAPATLRLFFHDCFVRVCIKMILLLMSFSLIYIVGSVS